MSEIPVIRFSGAPDSDTARVLSAVRDALMRHPVAAQAAFGALAAEGRRFSKTKEGAEWLELLGKSELAARLRVIWESLGMTAFAEGSADSLPSFFVDGIIKAAADRGLEELLSRSFDSEL